MYIQHQYESERSYYIEVTEHLIWIYWFIIKLTVNSLSSVKCLDIFNFETVLKLKDYKDNIFLIHFFATIIMAEWTLCRLLENIYD